MDQVKLKKLGLASTGWFFAVLWFFIYVIPLCANQFWGKDCDVTIISPFMKIQPASSFAIVSLIIIVPIMGFITGVASAFCCNVLLRLSGGVKLEIEIKESEPGNREVRETPAENLTE